MWHLFSKVGEVSGISETLGEVPVIVRNLRGGRWNLPKKLTINTFSKKIFVTFYTGNLMERKKEAKA